MTQKSLNYLFCRASHTHTRAFRSSWRRRLRDDGTERMMKVHGTKPLRYSERTRTRLQRHVCIRVNSDVSYARRRTGRAHAVTDDDNNDMEETTSAVRVFGHERKSHLGPAAMAYIGDAVWELALRSRELDSARALTGVRPRVAARARAEYQAAALRALEKSGSLSTEEESIVRWGRNASVKVPNRLLAHGSAGPRVYKSATALECLLGSLHVEGDHSRVDVLIEWICTHVATP